MCGYIFVIMVKGKKALVSDAVKEVKGTFVNRKRLNSTGTLNRFRRLGGIPMRRFGMGDCA